MTTRTRAGERRVLLPRNAVGRNRFSLAMSSQEVRPLSDNLTPSTVPLPVRKFTCATYAIWHPDIANGRYRVGRSDGAIDLPVLTLSRHCARRLPATQSRQSGRSTVQGRCAPRGRVRLARGIVARSPDGGVQGDQNRECSSRHARHTRACDPDLGCRGARRLLVRLRHRGDQRRGRCGARQLRARRGPDRHCGIVRSARLGDRRLVCGLDSRSLRSGAHHASRSRAADGQRRRRGR